MKPETNSTATDTLDEESVDELLSDLRSLIDASRQMRRPTDVEKAMESGDRETIQWNAEEPEVAASTEDLIAPHVLFSDDGDSEPRRRQRSPRRPSRSPSSPGREAVTSRKGWLG